MKNLVEKQDSFEFKTVGFSLPSFLEGCEIMTTKEKKMKTIIEYFIRYGSQTNLSYERKEFIDMFPLLSVLARNNANTKSLCINNNWFWLEENLDLRNAFADDIARVKRFEDGDDAYDDITHRFIDGDGYGIITPVIRAQEEPYDSKAYDEAFDWYENTQNVVSSWSLLYTDRAFKVIYCAKKELPFSTIDNWYTCEMLVGSPLNYAEYKVVDGILYGGTDDLKGIYKTEEYYDIINRMRDALYSYRITGVPSSSVLLIGDINSKLNLPFVPEKELEAAERLYKTFSLLYEPAEGESDEAKRKRVAEKLKYVNLLKDKSKYLLCLDRLGNVIGEK